MLANSTRDMHKSSENLGKKIHRSNLLIHLVYQLQKAVKREENSRNFSMANYISGLLTNNVVRSIKQL